MLILNYNDLSHAVEKLVPLFINSCRHIQTFDSSVGRAVDCRSWAEMREESIGRWFNSGSKELTVITLQRLIQNYK